MRVFTTLPILILLFQLPIFVAAQDGCPGCLIGLPVEIPEDTIYISDAPDGHVGNYYDGDMSFRMPKTTTPVNASDPEVPAGFDINSITIVGVSNLPPGLTWEPSQTDFVPEDETDGCVKICGTPLQSGLFEVEVNVTAQVFVVEQSTSFTFPLLIQTDTSATEGFTLINDNGCGEITASFINNIPSNGVEGFSYLWNFGNGNYSLDENPINQTYSEPGTYEVSYQAIVDTSQYYLSKVTVNNVGCNDVLGGAPDLYIEISDPEGEIIYQPAEIQNASTPLNFNMYLPIGEGEYLLRVIDDDQGIDGGDDICGVFNFTQLSNGTYSDGETSIDITILHQVDTINSVDTVVVFPIPDAPELESDGIEPICKGDIVTLSSSYDSNNQWFVDGVLIEGATDQELEVTTNGSYQVQFTSQDGCTSLSESMELIFNEEPPIAPFFNENNLLQISDPDQISDQYTIQWLFNDSIIPDESDIFYCISESGTYSVVIVDIVSGCKSVYSSEEAYDPNFPNCVNGLDELVLDEFKVFPNPVSNNCTIEADFPETGNVHLEISNAIGQVILQKDFGITTGFFQYQWNMSEHPEGIYILQLGYNDKQKTVKLVKTQ